MPKRSLQNGQLAISNSTPLLILSRLGGINLIICIYSSCGVLNYDEFRAAIHPTWCMARPVRLERTTCGFEVRRSIQLSYGRFGVSEGTRTLDHWGHNPVLYPTELHSPSKRSLQNDQLAMIDYQFNSIANFVPPRRD